MGSINTVLPKKIDKDAEKIILGKIKDKASSGIALYVNTLRWIEKKYGKEALEEIRKIHHNRTVDRFKKLRSEFKDNSLETFCKYMDEKCAGSKEFTITVDEKDRKCYTYTRCLWADIFRELGAEDIGFWICETDEPALKAFNPDIRFKRTKTLMQGDKCCNHEYNVEKQ